MSKFTLGRTALRNTPAHFEHAGQRLCPAYGFVAAGKHRSTVASASPPNGQSISHRPRIVLKASEVISEPPDKSLICGSRAHRVGRSGESVRARLAEVRPPR